ncbi:MAG: DUF1223 domain-containing protein [Phycisphaeraceae bacterium]|nr:DUF1223 domain-containing protein [Phycisphaeraceae bacterium]
MRPLTRGMFALLVGALGVCAVSQAKGPAVVELFTSEGCSSCPPADSYLGEIARTDAAQRGDVILLAWHVDYWDSLGWTDPFGMPQATSRQRAYDDAMQRRRVQGAGVYTPQMIVNGRRALVGSDRSKGDHAIESARDDDVVRLDVRAHLDNGRLIEAAAALPPLPPSATVIGLLVENGLRSDVRAGENRGRTLLHERVVRVAAVAVRSVAADRARVELPLPAGVDPAKTSVVLLAQASDMGEILAAGSAPLVMQTPAPERYRTMRIVGEEMRYAVLLPEGFDPSATYPAVLALPPGAQDEAMVEAGLGRYWENLARTRGWIVVSPIAPGFAPLFHSDEDPLGALTAAIASQYRIEGGKLHLAGVSNGGRSAFDEAVAHPDRYASLTVLPGMLARNTPRSGIKGLGKLPITMYVGGSDPDWLREGRRTVDELRREGIDATLRVLDGQGHVVSIDPDNLAELLESHRP